MSVNTRTAAATDPGDGPVVDPDNLAASRAIQRRTGPTFHLATRLFPPAVRHATYALYGFVRIADEVVDGGTERDPAAQRRALARLRAMALGEESTDHPVLAGFVAVREAYGIRRADVEAFLDAMVADVDGAGTRYRSVDELGRYIGGSAAAVGHMMTDVMGVEDPAARSHAASLGAAFQLTNFLRDVREDVVELDRIYLPAETLARHGASHADIVRLQFDDGVAAAVREELRRAEGRYRHGVAGIRYLPRRCRLPVVAAAVLYAEYHRLIRERDYDVVSARPRLGRLRKLRLLARTGYHWLRTRDPEATFYAASDVSPVANEPRMGRAESRTGRPAAVTGGNRGD